MFPHKTLLVWAFISLASSLCAQQWIGVARTQPTDAIVTVKGIVLNGPELGAIRYIQDETGAIALYPGSGSAPGFEALQAGDEVLVTGALDTYQGLLEISPILSFEILSSGNPLPEPETIFPSDFSSQRESRLVALQCVSFQEGGVFGANTSYVLDHYGGIGFVLYIPSGHPLVGQPIPSGPIELRGVLSRFNNFRILPRGPGDLIPSPCLYFTSEVVPADLQTDAMSLDWTTNAPCDCKLQYGPTPEMTFETASSQALTAHSFLIEGLSPATAWYARARCEVNGYEMASPLRIYSTASTSSGQIEVYFTQFTNPAVASGSFPAGNTFQQLEAAVLERIDQAEYSIDVAVYNANMSAWIGALTEAHNRGVRVRYVYEDEANNTALAGPPPFPILPGNPGALMHHKFMIIDAEYPEKSWLLTGSMNWTSSGLKNDYNNMLFFQDQAIAKAYRTEFEEMWGSAGSQPDLAKARFGPAKLYNTPEYFKIGGRLVENHFTPSTRIVGLIRDRLATADQELFFGLFILTQDELSAALKDAWFAGRDVRGIIEDVDISGSDYYFLLSQGVPVQEHTPPGQFHHKYALVDPRWPASDPMVVTGSYNWTAAATNVNDENVLVIHDAEIANWFWQEFQARWSVLAAVSTDATAPSPLRVFPNPTAGDFFVEWTGGEVLLRLWDANGRLLQERRASGRLQMSAPGPGLYLLTCTLPDGGIWAKKLIVK
jgi:phosphatidylserine/phosphatidylglycerophosphate/cardiolipin synthase-like enzyme